MASLKRWGGAILHILGDGEGVNSGMPSVTAKNQKVILNSFT